MKNTTKVIIKLVLTTIVPLGAMILSWKLVPLQGNALQCFLLILGYITMGNISAILVGYVMSKILKINYEELYFEMLCS